MHPAVAYVLYRLACDAADDDKELEREGLRANVKARASSFFTDLMRTLKEPVFVCTMFGYAVYTGGTCSKRSDGALIDTLIVIAKTCWHQNIQLLS